MYTVMRDSTQIVEGFYVHCNMQRYTECGG
jgi:hypothetical protein